MFLLVFASTAQAQEAEPDSGPPTPVEIILTVVISLLLIGLIGYTTVKQYRHAQAIRDTDWVEYFTDVLNRSQPRANEDEKVSDDHEGLEKE